MSTTPEPMKGGGGVMPTMPGEVREKAREAGTLAAHALALDPFRPGEWLQDGQRLLAETSADAAAEVAYAAGRADERARVAAWLRARTIRNDLGIEYPDYAARDLAALLDGRAGEHLDD